MATSPRIQVVPNGDALIEALGAITDPRRPVFKAQGPEHGDCDMRLFEKITDILTPILGRWDDKDSRWYHELDYYGTGIRVLAFKPGAFLVDVVPQLRALLAGEHELFGIICWAETDLKPDESEGVLIFSHITYVTPGFKSLQ